MKSFKVNKGDLVQTRNGGHFLVAEMNKSKIVVDITNMTANSVDILENKMIINNNEFFIERVVTNENKS